MKSMIIDIAEPCSQDWTAMEERGIGRHCFHCSKTVVDFTNFTDEQMVTFFQRSDGNVCGRIESGRLNIPHNLTSLPNRNRIQWLYPLTAILALFGINKANAQTGTSQVTPTHVVNDTQADTCNTYSDSIKAAFIEIQILDAARNPLKLKSPKVQCSYHDTLNYTVDNGVVKIPTSQFEHNYSLELQINDNTYYGSVSVSQYSLTRYEVILRKWSNIKMGKVKCTEPQLNK